MSTVDDAVEAGARALSESEYGEGPHDSRLAALAVTAAWPILSEGLRGLHAEREWRPLDGTYFGGTVCGHCRRAYPCATVRELDRIDKELGL